MLFAVACVFPVSLNITRTEYYQLLRVTIRAPSGWLRAPSGRFRTVFAAQFLLDCNKFQEAKNILLDTVTEISDLSGQKKRLRLSEALLLAPIGK